MRVRSEAAAGGTDAGRAPYRHRVALLAAGEAVEARLDEWAAGQEIRRWGPWRRVYGKLRPHRSPWALLVYEAEGGPTVQVRLFEPGDDPKAGPGAHPAGDLGRAQVLRCEDDPALPGLAPVMASLEDPRVVRCHPGNRCTVRGGHGSDARFVKVLSEVADDQAEVRARWEAARAGVLSFAVAAPHGWDARTLSSWYGVVPGEPVLASLTGRGALDLVRRVGASIGELAISPLHPARNDDAAKQLARTERTVERAALTAPGLGAALQRALDPLRQAHERLGPRPLMPIHGAAHLGQWLVDDTGRLGLIDFDRFAMGEPEFDLATFLVELQAAEKRMPAEELEQALLDGFLEVAGTLDEQRLTVYRLHKRLARAARTAAGLNPDGEERAARQLEGLEAPLGLLVRGRA